MKTRQTIKRLQLKQGDKLLEAVDKRYVDKVLGGEPTRSKVREDNPDDNPITIMQWAGLLFFAVLAFFAMFKVVPTATLYAEEFYGDNAGQEFFTVATVLVFAMMNTVGFIYAKLQTEDEGIQRKMMLSKNKPFWSVEYWSPRLFHALVYIILFWQVLIALSGIHDYFSPIQWADAILPVLAEIASAALIAEVLIKVRNRNKEINAAYKLRKDWFKTQMSKRYNDEKWLEIVFQMLRELMAKKNPALETAASDRVNEIVLTEYLRLNAGQDFAVEVFNARKDKLAISHEIDYAAAEIEMAEQIASSQTGRATGLRKPPNSEREWSVDSLKADFAARDDISSSTDYTEKQLNEEYANGYHARRAFRQGAKTYFKRYK